MGLLGRLTVIELIGVVKRPAGFAAEQGTDQRADAGRDQLPRAASDQRSREAAKYSATDSATRLLLPVSLASAA
jgi:hypothetical protein